MNLTTHDPAMSNHTTEPVHFPTKDAVQIQKMFSEIAPSYDLTNTVLSGGIHHLWRKALVRFSDARPGQRVLDCATGTGDLAFEFKRAVGPFGKVIGTDFCQDMLALAPSKAEKLGLDVTFSQADATQLPYQSSAFNVASISFGIRNVSNPMLAIKELARVVRPGGVVMILEFGQPEIPLFRWLYSLYTKYVLPKIGGWLTGKKSAYQYLQDSSEQFPCGKKFVKLIMSSGHFSRCDVLPLSFGIAYMYKATVKPTPGQVASKVNDLLIQN